MSAIPVPPTPPRDPRIPELTTEDVSTLITQYLAQIKYYENGKPWKYYLRRILWKFAKSVNFKYSKNMLMGHIVNEINNDLLTFEDIDDTFNPKEIEKEIEKFIQYYAPVLKDYEQYFGETENVPEFDKSLFTEQTALNIYWTNKLNQPFTSTVRCNEFITMWYQQIDKNKVVPLFFLHRKRFYDWFGNKSLQATIDIMADKPKEKWRYVLKKMCKIGVIDHEYIRHTCDMSWVTEELLMMETERYIQRYESQKMTNMKTNTNTVLSPG